MSGPVLDHRRLVVMLTDMADSAALRKKLGDDAYVHQVLGPHDEIFRGILSNFPDAQEIKHTGDGFLATFSFIKDAVRAALQFQHQIRVQAWEQDPPRVRIAIHVGEGVIVKGSHPGKIDIQAHFVDMCARLLSLALPRQILLTRHAYDDARQFVREHPRADESQASLTLEWLCHGLYVFKGNEEDPLEVFEVGALGLAPLTQPPSADKATRITDRRQPSRSIRDHRVRNKYLVLSAMAVIGLGAAYGFHLVHAAEPHDGNGVSRPSTPSHEIARSVAVFDLKNASGRTGDSWMSQSLGSIVSNDLSIGNQLAVIPARDVLLAARDLKLSDVESMTPESLSDVKRRLHADYVVTGSYLALGRESGGQISVQLWLYDTTSGKLLASSSKKGLDRDIFSLLEDPSDHLRAELSVAPLASSDLADMVASVPGDPRAARLYSEARKAINSFNALEAIPKLDEAIAIAPKNPLLRAELAEAYSELGHDSKASEEAKIAFQLSADLSPQKRSLVEGRYLELTYQWDKALEIYRTFWIRFPNQPEFGFRLAAAETAAGRGRDAIATLLELQHILPSDDPDARIEIMKADAYETLADFREVHDSAKKSADAARKMGARLLLARALTAQGEASLNLGDLKEAMSVLQEARDIHQSIGNRAGVARAINNIATVLSNQGDVAGARKMYSEAVKITGEIGDKYDLQGALNNLANALFMQRDLAGANELYQKGLELAQERGSKPEIAVLLSNLASVQQALGNLPGADAGYAKALSAALEANNGITTARVHYNLGVIAVERGDLEGARKHYQESLEIRDSLGLRSGSAEAKVGLGDVLLAQGNFDQAAQSYQQALSTQEKLGEKNDAAYSRLSLAQVALERGQSADAETSFREVAADFQSQQDADAEALARAGLARALLSERKTTDAQAETQRAVAVGMKSPDVTVRLTVLIASARLKAAQGNPAGAVQSLRSAFLDAGKFGLTGIQFEARLALGEATMLSGKEPAGRAALNELKQEASSRGFALIARRTDAALTGDSTKLAMSKH